MKQKEQDLLIYLADNPDRFVTSKELSTILSLTPRSIRSYIKVLKEQLENQGARIESKPSVGYRLQILHPVTFDLFLNKHCSLLQEHTNKDHSSNIADRQKYILNKLIIENKKIRVDDLADRLFVTRSSLSKDLAVIRKELLPYRITIESKANTGIFISGLERDRRHFILDYFFSHSEHSLQHYMKNKSFFKTISFDQLTIIVLDECRESGIYLTDFTIQNIVLYIALSIERLDSGFILQPVVLNTSYEQRTFYEVSEKIFTRIENSLDVKVPESEVAYLTIQLLAHGKTGKLTDDGTLQHEVEHVLEQIELESAYPVSKDYDLEKNLIEHLKPMIVRLENGIQLKNPLLKEIKTNYSNYFTDTKRYIKWSSYLSQFDINDDEIAYLVLHLLATVEKYKNLNKPRTLIICATGYGSAQLLNNRLEKEFSKYLNIVDIKGYYEIDDSILNNIDLIISTIDLSTQVFKVPVIQVSVFLTETDVQKLNQYLDNQRMHAKQKKFITDREIDTKPTFNYFDQFASDSRFKIWHTPTNKNTVLKELIEKISSEETQDFQDELLKQINQREALSAITFSDTIVVPHPAIPMSHVPKIAIGITPKGLKWSEEYPNVKFVFLLSPSYWNNRGLTETTQAIVRLTEDVEKQNDLIISKSFSEFRDTFLSMIEGGTSA